MSARRSPYMTRVRLSQAVHEIDPSLLGSAVAMVHEPVVHEAAVEHGH